MTERQAGGGVLVVDDEEEILELLQEYLTVRGYRAWTARNGQEALDRIRTEQVDVILTDMKMPTLGGIELLELVSALPRPIAVVMMTGFGTVETAIHAMKLGAADYVLKPFKLRDIHKALTSAHDRVEALRNQRLDAALREFYEYCHGRERSEELSDVRELLVELLIEKIGLSAAGVWARAEQGLELAAGRGDESALESLERCLQEGQKLAVNQIVSEVSGEDGVFIGVCLDEDSRCTGEAAAVKRGLEGLSLSLSRVVERLTQTVG
jgi:FixJ family two-component response regulator